MSFAIYTGAGRQHDRIEDLPAPPPWRRFDGEILPSGRDAVPSGVGVRPGDALRASSYRADPTVVDKVNAALYLRRPLLVTGKPGTGKSSLALSIAWELRLGRVLHWPITSRAQLQQALYQYDALGQLQDANLRRAEEGDPRVGSAGPYITLGPLGTALVGRTRPRVLLIDEFDKGDIDLPNDLLTVIEEGQFAVPELIREGATEPVPLATVDGSTAEVRGGRVHCHAFPVIVITSNGERAFPEAFLRRCVQVTIPPPSEQQLRDIVAAQLGPDALDRSRELFEAFVERMDMPGLPTDRLLNAIYLAMSGLPGDDADHRRVAHSLLETSERDGL